MTAADIIALRTGADATKAGEYASLAEMKVREYLRYGTNDSVDRFISTVADVGVLFYQRDTQVAATIGTSMGVRSASFSEGGVSESKTYLSAGDLIGAYDTRVDKVLEGINRFRRVRVVVGVTGDSQPPTTENTVRITEG